MARGDHLRIERPGFWHHGIDLGDGTVVHFTSVGSGPLRVQRTPLHAFGRAEDIEVLAYDSCFHPDHTCVTALRFARGEAAYRPASNNCEHVATYCKTEQWESLQVRASKERMARDARMVILRNPAMLLAVPLLEAGRLGVKAGAYAMKRLFTSSDEERNGGPNRVPAMFRLANLFQDRQDIRWSQNYAARWSRWNGTGWIAAPGPSGELTYLSTLWCDAALSGYSQELGGWKDGSGHPLSAMQPAYDPDSRPARFAAAPPGALNAVLQLPDSVWELREALAETCIRGWGDIDTYHATIRWIVWDGNPDEVREQACMTLASLHKFQGRRTPAALLLGLREIAAVTQDESQPERVRIAAIEAIRLMWRSPHEVFRAALAPAAVTRHRKVRQAVTEVLNAAGS